jgi:hypothetical protein
LERQERIQKAWRSKDQIALEGDIINQGVSAAENLPRLEETLDLMKKINTGGFTPMV